MVNWTEIRKSVLGDGCESVLPPRVKLPMLPHAVMQFSQKAEDPDASSAELAMIIETDTGLTCELLRYVNSAAFGMRRKASSAQHAISMLGIRETKLFLMSNGIKRAMRSSESKLINLKNFWAANLERGLFARELAVLMNVDHELAFSAGMLQDFLLPVVTNQLFPTYFEFTKQPCEQPVSLVRFEREKFKWDHALAGAQVMLGWKFPDDLVCCVLFHHRGLELLTDLKLKTTAAAAVAISALMPGFFEQVPNGLERLIQLEQHWPAFRLVETAERVQDQFAVLAPGFADRVSFVRRCKRALVASG